MESKETFLESMKARVAENIKKAKERPILESRLVKLEIILNAHRDKFIETGQRSAEAVAEEDMIEFEILHSTALADTIGEFRETLEQIRVEFGLTQEWVDDLVAHENAHANVARDTGHEWVGYGAVFIKDDNGQLSAVQPVHFTKPDLSWGPMELITKSIEVTEAPAVYGNKLSEGDVANLEQDKARLEKIREQLGLK